MPKAARSPAKSSSAAPAREPRKMSAYNKFMKEELARLKASKSPLDHKAQFKAAAAAWKKSPDRSGERWALSRSRSRSPVSTVSASRLGKENPFDLRAWLISDGDENGRSAFVLVLEFNAAAPGARAVRRWDPRIEVVKNRRFRVEAD
ncbi:MAG: hypothetical protein BJ554DRAFT_6488 [Olpidium bornovanus]|uniref:YABBY protein C-terminal domain-containing protein n=1 Tax=Olpidium bornovanus TaxID=278681 RepID=A0A8H8DJY2_9FUNG|nr:MAG: hypothetical protein BJ554DRAFT_6488 [Olpidium bornovanus]